MDYGPKIPYDEFSCRIAKCPRCLYDKHREDAVFCIMCGTSLYNRSPNDHPNPPDARYCSHCGEETEFFQQSILKPYHEILRERIAEAKSEVEEMGLSSEDFINGLESITSAPATDSPTTDELPF